MATALTITLDRSKLLTKKADITATLLRIVSDPDQDTKFNRLLKKLDDINSALKKSPDK